jgi:hypothetical protein
MGYRLFLLLFFCFHHLYSQNLSQSAEISCRPAEFWAIDGFGNILHFSMAFNVISFEDTVFTGSPVTSLAFNNSLNASSIPQTFYGSNPGVTDSLGYFNGSAWIKIPVSFSNIQINCAGYGNHLYFNTVANGASFLNQLNRFNGASFSNVYETISPGVFSGADFAVDESGNTWILKGSYALQSDSLLVIDSTGIAIRSFAITLDVNHGYGSFMDQGILYLALGSGNTVHPNSLLEIGFNGSSAFIQNVIPFPNNDFMDLASCYPGKPLILSTEKLNEDKNVIAFPNPFRNEINFKLSMNINSSELKIYNNIGEEILSENNFHKLLPLPTAKFSTGIYFFRIKINDATFFEKLIKN